jgi:hypothetical protein
MKTKVSSMTTELRTRRGKHPVKLVFHIEWQRSGAAMKAMIESGLARLIAASIASKAQRIGRPTTCGNAKRKANHIENRSEL